MAGNNTGSASNVFVDSDGYLHLKITQSNGKWLCAELFTQDTLGFGTYRWQIDAPIDRLDKNVVLGLFPYGPIVGTGADGTNEIDIEYARWGDSTWDNGNFTVYPNSGTVVGQSTFTFSMAGTYSTSSFDWSATSIRYRAQEGFKAVGDTTGTFGKWTYAPSNPSTNIPQKAVPLGMNLWLCSECTQAPSDGKPVEVIVRQFLHLPPGATTGIVRDRSEPVSDMRIATVGRTLRIAFPAPLDAERIFDLLDPSGRTERTFVAGRGSSEATLRDLAPGLHLLLDRSSRESRSLTVFDSD
jgi:hypothetical protein